MKPKKRRNSRKELFELRLYRRTREAEVLEQVRALARRAEVIESDDAALRAHVSPPRLRASCRDGEPARPRRRQHAFSIRRRLRIEDLAAGHGDQAHALACGLQFLDRGHRETHFGTRRDDDGFRWTIAVDEHVTAFAQRYQLFGG